MKGLFGIIMLVCLFSLPAKSYTTLDTEDSVRYIKLQLIKDAIYKDETIILFKNNANIGYDVNEDSKYFQGAGQVRLYSFKQQTEPMVHNTQPFPATISTTGLYVFARTDGLYKLHLSNIVNVPALFNIWLIDRYMKDSIDLRHNPTYSFNITKADTNSFGSNRFTIVIKREKSRDSRLLSFAADKVSGSKHIQINWTTENESTTTVYTLERSDDKGKTFSAIDSVRSTDAHTYSITDTKAAEGINIYRLKQKDLTDIITYSETREVDNTAPRTTATVKNTNEAPAIYPNPANSVVNIALNAKHTDNSYRVAITDMWGLKVKEGNTNGPQWQSEVSDLKPGMYMVTVTNADSKIIGYTKFMKK